MATDVQSWAISALGVEKLNTFEKDLAEKTIQFVEKHCYSQILYTNTQGEERKVSGVDSTKYSAIKL